MVEVGFGQKRERVGCFGRCDMLFFCGWTWILIVVVGLDNYHYSVDIRSPGRGHSSSQRPCLLPDPACSGSARFPELAIQCPCLSLSSPFPLYAKRPKQGCHLVGWIIRTRVSKSDNYMMIPIIINANNIAARAGRRLDPALLTPNTCPGKLHFGFIPSITGWP